METGADSVADSDNINTSTPWKLRFIKSPVVSSPICKQDDCGFDLFVSGLQDKVSSPENSIKEDPEAKIQTNSTRELEGLPCDNIIEVESVSSRNSDRGSTSVNVSSIVCLQTTNSLQSAKLWKPVDTSYDTFIVLDETIMIDDSSDDDSFQKSDENFAKNVSGILPLNQTAKLVNSPVYDATKLGNVTNLILDVTNDSKDESKLDKSLLQNVTSTTAVENNNNENKTKELDNFNMQDNPPDTAEDDKTHSVSSNLVTNKPEPNLILEHLPRNGGNIEQSICTDEEGDKLVQVYSFEETVKTKQINDCGKTEELKFDTGETGKFEKVKSDNRGIGNLEKGKYDIGETGKLEQLKPDNRKIGKLEKVKSEGEETEQVKSDERETEMSQQMKSENLITDSIDQVKSEREKTEKLKYVDEKTEQVKSNKRATGQNERVKSENMESVNIEQVKFEREETDTLKSAVVKTEEVKSNKRDRPTGKSEQLKSENMENGYIEQVKSEREDTETVVSAGVKTEEVRSNKRDTGKSDQVNSENMETGNIEQVESEREATETVESLDGMSEQAISDDTEPGEIKEEKSDNLEFGKLEQVKPDNGDFVSSDPEENADNNNPEWELLKKLETDEERYKAVRLRWRNLVIPNPNKNLTYRSRGYWTTEEKQKQVSEVRQNPIVTSRKRTHSADPIEHHIPAKRQRTFSCTEVFDRKMLDIHKNLSRERNAILQQHERAVQNLVNKTNHQLRSYPPGSVNDERIRALHVQNVVELRYKCDNRLAAVESESMNKLRTLEKAMEEVRVFNTFYQGLEEGCDDALLLTDEQLMEVLEEDHLYECFAEYYNG